MTWCPLLCYPLSPSPVNIERFFKLGAKFCRKIYSSQALNCFLLLVHTASSFATGQIDVSERVPMFEDDNLDDLDIGLGLEDLLSSRMGRSPFAFPFQGSPSPTAPSSPGVRSPSASPFHGFASPTASSAPGVRSPSASPFHRFPSPTASSAPGTRASRTDWLSESSSMQDDKAGELGQEEDFGECCSRLSLQVFGVVSRFGVVWIYHWQLSLFRVLNTRCLPPIELPTSGNMTAPVQITQLSTRLPSPSLPVLRGKEKHK